MRGAPVCNVRRSDQICRCRRECADIGPWECVEEGCPARVVDCKILRVACNAPFSAIWRKVPRGMSDTYVRRVCPLTCGHCMTKLAEPHTQFKVPSFLVPGV